MTALIRFPSISDDDEFTAESTFAWFLIPAGPGQPVDPAGHAVLDRGNIITNIDSYDPELKAALKDRAAEAHKKDLPLFKNAGALIQLGSTPFTRFDKGLVSSDYAAPDLSDLTDEGLELVTALETAYGRKGALITFLDT